MPEHLSRVGALIVDDEPWARERVRSLLGDEPAVEVLGESCSGLEAVAAIAELEPDLVFLDVQMPDLDGFGVIEQVGGRQMPAVIFVTAYDQHALQAFEVHALDYLLKPFDRKRFHAAVRRAVELIQAGNTSLQVQRLEQLLAERGPVGRRLDRFLVRGNDRFYFVRAESVDWIEAAGNYVRLHADGLTHLVRQTMKRLEQELDPELFVRIHRSAIVNIDRVAEIRPLFSGEYLVQLKSGVELTLSKSYRDRLLQSLC
jgi:two-component system LytT family response regulator